MTEADHRWLAARIVDAARAGEPRYQALIQRLVGDLLRRWTADAKAARAYAPNARHPSSHRPWSAAADPSTSARGVPYSPLTSGVQHRHLGAVTWRREAESFAEAWAEQCWRGIASLDSLSVDSGRGRKKVRR